MKDNTVTIASWIIIVFIIILFINGNSQSQKVETKKPAENKTTNNNEQDNTISTSAINNNTPVISSEEMSQSCQSVADAQLRNGYFESSVVNYSSAYIKPSKVTNLSHYDVQSSICYIVTATEVFPRVISVSDPSIILSVYLYGVAMTPEGEPQTPREGDSVMQLSAWCIGSQYHYPKEAYESKCINFNLRQIGAGTNNYSTKALGVGVTMSKTDFTSLLNKSMAQDVVEVLNKEQF